MDRIEEKNINETDLIREQQLAEKTMDILDNQPCRIAVGDYISRPLSSLMMDGKSEWIIYGHFFNLGYICGVRKERARRKPGNEADFIREQISQQAGTIQDIKTLRTVLAFVRQCRGDAVNRQDGGEAGHA